MAGIDLDSSALESTSAERLGVLFAVAGVGTVVGIVAETTEAWPQDQPSPMVRVGNVEDRKASFVTVKEQTITTQDGEMPTWIYHPSHDGPSPVVLYMMDAPSIRPALHEMASRLATAGYYVMLPYLFYRGGPFREFGKSDEDMHARRDLMDQLNPTNILGDVEALLATADADPAAGDGNVGAVGFCMSGGSVISAARAMPDRVAAVASIHGAWLVTDRDDSPHNGLESVSAEVYLGWADNDATAPPEDVPIMEQALKDAGVTYTLDFLTEAVHGYAPPGGQNYNREASELHWERVHALFQRHLR